MQPKFSKGKLLSNYPCPIKLLIKQNKDIFGQVSSQKNPFPKQPSLQNPIGCALRRARRVLGPVEPHKLSPTDPPTHGSYKLLTK